MSNQKIICVDCGEEEEITEGWKKLIADKPKVQLPKRCYKCRQARKAEKRSDNKRW